MRRNDSNGGVRRALAPLLSLTLAIGVLGFVPGAARAAVSYGWAKSPSDVTPVRSGPAVAQDGTTSPASVLLFGGTSSTGPVNDTWRWSGSGWTKIAPATSPSARSGAALVYDPVRHQDVLFGGSGSSGVLNDTWTWNGTTWKKLTPGNSPPARLDASAVWDPVRSVMILFGGASKNAKLQDTWTWNGTTWTQLALSTKPVRRSGAAAAFDPVSGTMILFGGAGDNAPLADTWRWTGTSWIQLTMAASPSARTGARAAVSPVTRQIILFGGLSGAESNETWMFAGTTWTKLTPAQAPAARDSAGFAPGADGSLVLVDGNSGTGQVAGTWIWQTTPAAPQSVTATAQNRQATVTWAVPLTGGSPLTSYTVTASPGGATATSTSTRATVVGLQVATAYTFTVTATNALGPGAASAASNAATTWDLPGTPRSVTALPGDGQVTVSWQAPASDGGSPITGYTVTPYTGTVAQAATTVGALASSATIMGLTDGAVYTFKVAAVTAVGTGAAGASASVTPVAVPGVPRNVTAVSGHAQVTVSWQAPASDGGSPITGYTVTPYIGTVAQAATIVGALASSATISGLANATTYTFTVTATNALGSGTSSAASNAASTWGLPSAPRSVTALAGDAQLTVSWQAPASDGGSPITGYTVTAFIGSAQQSTITVNAATTATTIGGLVDGTGYVVTVAASSIVGTGSSSSASATPSNLSSGPLNVTAVANGSDRVTVAWQPPLTDGGSPITSYVVTPYQGTTALTPVTMAASPATFTGLTGSTTYTYSVAATNANGTGAPTTSAPVTTAVIACPVSGATNVWTGAAGTTSWTTAGNWSAGRVPTDTDITCLPAGTLGADSISVPVTTVEQLISFKPLTLAGGLATTAGADFEADAVWTGGTLAGPSLNVGSGVTIVVSGQITLAGSIAITNNGTMQIAGGGSPLGVVQGCNTPGNTASWLNVGTLVFSDSSGSSVNLCPGSFTNTGSVTHPGTARDVLFAGQMTSSGSITAQAGFLQVYSGSLTGGSIGGGAGQVILDGPITTTAAVAIGDNVWVVGTLSGTVAVPAGATLHVGYDGAFPVQASSAGSVSGTVTGAGTLNVTGHEFSGPGQTYDSIAGVAADLTVDNVILGDFTALSAKPDSTPTAISSNTAVQVAGYVTLSGSVAITNNGTVDVTVGAHQSAPNGGVSQGCNTPGNTASWLNVGTLAFSDSTGGSVSLCSGTFTNTGSVTHTGAGHDLLIAGHLTSSGSISAQAGLLQVYSGSLTGGSIGGGAGQVILDGPITTTPSVAIGDNVWVVGTLSGTAAVSAGATLHVGYDGAYPVQGLAAGTVSGTVTGAGTLSVTGHEFSVPGNTFDSIAVAAADLGIANVILGDYTTLAVKPDSTPTVVSSNTTVTVATTPTLASGISVLNHGVMNFGANGYFTCGNCTFTNETDGTLGLDNPDGTFTHGFAINSGTFDNEGIVRLTGYLPGTWVWFGPNVTLTNVGAGRAEVDSLQQPTWIRNLQTSAGVAPFATALTQGGLAGLFSNGLMAGAAALKDLGVGACTDVNASIGVAGASTGICKVIDPQGHEAVVLTVSGGLSLDLTADPLIAANVLPGEPSVSVDVGGQVMWTTGGASGRKFTIGDLDGLSWCRTGSLVFPPPLPAGGTGQHCWGPQDHVPFALNTPTIDQPGAHSLYLGAVLGTPDFTVGASLSYSVTIDCAQWYSLTLQLCTPANRIPPTISGTAAIGSALTANPGAWAPGTPDPTYAVSDQWERCTTADQSSCSPISGATSPTYTPVASDSGSWIAVRVTASNTGGSSSMVAGPDGPVP